jgi:hypothetical protein
LHQAISTVRRWSIPAVFPLVQKAPLTGGIKESNVGKRPLTFEGNGPKICH